MNKNIFYTLIVGCILLLSPHTYGQSGLKTGSLQISAASGVSVAAEITGPLTLRETISGSLIIANLPPGIYTVKVYPYAGEHSRRMGNNNNRNTIVNQAFTISSERRTIINVSRNGFSTSSVPDQSGQYINAGTNPNSRPEYPDHRPGPGIQTMSDKEFSQFCGAVKAPPFDSDKMKVVSVATPGVIFTTEQIRTVAKLFTYDDGKLDCIKAMSERVPDRQNLYLLADVFTFQSGKDKLYEFIRSTPSSPYNR